MYGRCAVENDDFRRATHYGCVGGKDNAFMTSSKRKEKEQRTEKHLMIRVLVHYFIYPVIVLGITAGVVGGAYAATNSNIDLDAKWAWSTNVGWINFNPPNGGVTVYDDHLEGYAWGENIGWIRLGTHTGGGAHTYNNSSTADYGVNRSGTGSLSGYAWGTNVGWINFDPEGEQGVAIDPDSGDFYGYAWGENVGWIHFNSSSPLYKLSLLIYHLYLPIIMRGS